MDDRRYQELLEAILDLRAATEAGFNRVDRRFDEVDKRWNDRLDRLEDAWGRRFNALERRFDEGFRSL
ncbi:MAG: hypothetical protein WB609_15100 [Candidatus Cybelea sp.]